MQYLNWYDIFISPLLKGLQKSILSQIDEGDSVLEVGCGTGQLAKALYQMGVNNYLGVDLNPDVIQIASRKVISKSFEFIAADFLDLRLNRKYDLAIFPMIIHSIPQELGENLIKKASKFANKIIVADYLVPQPKNYKALIVRIIEWLAGKEHFSSFKHYKDFNSISSIAENIVLIELQKIDYEVFQISIFEVER